MTKFSDGPSPARTPLTLMLQTGTCSFTLKTRDELPTALNICGKNIF